MIIKIKPKYLSSDNLFLWKDEQKTKIHLCPRQLVYWYIPLVFKVWDFMEVPSHTKE